MKEHVVKKIGAIARPDDILFTADLPKTRSGKIMRRLLRDIAEGKALGDTTTLADPAVVAKLKADYEEQEGLGSEPTRRAWAARERSCAAPERVRLEGTRVRRDSYPSIRPWHSSKPSTSGRPT